MAETQLAADGFDRFLQSADGLPGVRKTRPSTIRSTHPLTGVTATHIVQSYRTETGYTVLIERGDAGGHYRYVLPPEVSTAIYRQRQSLADRSTPESRARKAKSRELARKRQEREQRRQAWADGHKIP